jgi:hypothetical protein
MRILFLLVNTAFLRLFLEAKKKCLTPYGVKATKGCSIPKFPGLRAILSSIFPSDHLFQVVRQ